MKILPNYVNRSPPMINNELNALGNVGITLEIEVRLIS